jgi:RimJ/RimL family protein N-acetyltransferase
METDIRIIKWIEDKAGRSCQDFPDEGVFVCESMARTDEPKNRLLAQWISGRNGVLVTVIPRLVAAVKYCTEALADRELFSPFGLAEIKRALPTEDAKSLDETWGFDYFLTVRKALRPVKPQHKVIPLKKKDIPPEQHDLRMRERRISETDDFIWAFACYHKDRSVPATWLPEYCPLCAAVAVVIWLNDYIAGLGVGTEEQLRGRGYGLAVVSAAAKWILAQGGVAWYGAYSNNIPSVRIARRLGFSLEHSSFSA